MVMAGRTDNLVCVDDFEQYALRTLSKGVAGYYRGGANNEQTLKENRRAFSRLRIRPRCLRDVSKIDLSTRILGQPISFPIGVAPSAMQKMAHPDGEIANVKAASAAGTVMILSSISTTPLEDVAKAAPSGLKWFQLYIFRDREITKQLVSRAEESGYKALVLTIDQPFFGQRLDEKRSKFSLPSHLRLANFVTEDIKSSGLNKAKKDSSVWVYSESVFDPSLNWKDIHWLRSITTLPIVIKGVLTAEDAILAVQHGVDAILVSNHGGRQLDGVPATIEALPEVVRAVGGRCEVYLDGGIRTGTDVLKALALGAKAVFVGRPIIWGLVHSGQSGASRILDILKKDLEVALGLAGCTSIEDIKPSMVVRQEFYSRL